MIMYSFSYEREGLEMERKKKQSQMLSSSIYVWSRKVQLCNEVKNLQYMATSTFYSSAATEYKERDCCWGYQGVGGVMDVIWLSCGRIGKRKSYSD